MDPFASRTRRAVPAFIAALALGVTACGEEDVESGAKQGAGKAQDAAGKAEKAGKDAASKAEKEAKKAKKDAEK